MRAICVWVDDVKKSYEVAEKICFAFPCFVRIHSVQTGVLEIEVLCREEDAKGVESLLSEIVQEKEKRGKER